jgi:Zn-dependent protease with chaperone function
MSSAAIVSPLLVAAALGMAGPQLARRLPPRDATWLISAGAVVSALSLGAVLLLIGSVLVAQVPDIEGIGHWSAAILREDSPTEPVIGAVALLAALAGAGAALVAAIRQTRAMRAAARAVDGLAGGQSLVVIDGGEPGAFAIPGGRGRIVVTRSLLRRLSPGERRVLLAHERAHLEARHHWHRSVVSLAIAANPLLWPLRGAIAYATERWADERAATELGDRVGAARALARVALLSGGAAHRHPRLAAGQLAVPARVSALLADPPRHRPVLSAATIALMALAIAAAIAVEMRVESIFDVAVHVYRASGGG